MKMVGRPYQKPGSSGWWLRWTEPDTKKRVSKSFHTLQLAEKFWAVLYNRLNSGLGFSVVDIALSDAVKEYLDRYDLRGLSPAAKSQATYSLDRLLEVTGPIYSSKLRQAHLDTLIRRRIKPAEGEKRKAVNAWTVNKDIANLSAFLSWAADPARRYVPEGLHIEKLKTDRLSPKSLTTDQIQALLRAAKDSPGMTVRILLSLTTALRKNDLDGLPAASINLPALTIQTKEKKTRKAAVLPLPDALKPILEKYLSGRTGPLFDNRNLRKVWKELVEKAGLEGTARKKLRVTSSTMLQKVGSIGTAKTVLNHSSTVVTKSFYSDEEVILRWKVNQLEVAEWLKPLDHDSAEPNPH